VSAAADVLLCHHTCAAADAELARLITVKHFKTFPDRSMFYPPQDRTVDRVLSQGITFSK
jgi:hypothetical protein